MINSINLTRTIAVTCALMLNACANQPIQANNQSDHKTTNTQSIVVNNMVNVSVLDGFKVSSGPKEFDPKQSEVEQSLISVFDKPNQLVCQVAAKKFAKDEKRDSAIAKFRIKAKTVTMDSTQSLVGGAQQSNFRVMQSSGVELSFEERAYFFEASESIYDSPIAYRIFCGTETALLERNRPKIDEFFGLIEWL